MKEHDNDFCIAIITQAIEEMKQDLGNSFSLEHINLAELERKTGITRSRLRRLKKNGFELKPHGNSSPRPENSILTGFTAVLDNLLKKGITNSAVIMERLSETGYAGSLSTIKRYITAHKDLVPAKRHIHAPQGNRGIRYVTAPGESYQMDWGFAYIEHPYGGKTMVACFAMICHHCGKRYVEFFTNARQENLFIGMIHAFMYMGIPKKILTDNMKSVVIKRDIDNNPIWQTDYENFMKTVGFETVLCKPRHPFTKGKVERLIKFVKNNFLAGREFFNLNDLNEAAFDWCEKQNSIYHSEMDDIPNFLHDTESTPRLEESVSLMYYLCPLRRISFDGFVNFEGRRFGVPYTFKGKTVRVCRNKEILYIYSPDLKKLLVTHEVTWRKGARFCKDQFPGAEGPEEFPTMPVKTSIRQIASPEYSLSGFEKFNFGEEESNG